MDLRELLFGLLQQQQNDPNQVLPYLQQNTTPAITQNPLQNVPLPSPNPSPISLGLPQVSQFGSMLGNSQGSGLIRQPDFTMASNASLYSNPLDFMVSNQDLYNNANEYNQMVNSGIGTGASDQIQAIINDIQAKQAMLPKDVGFGTKLAGLLLQSAGGFTGNQALQAQGINLIEGSKQKLEQQKQLLNDQEIAARTLKYQSDLQQENKTRDYFLNIKDTAFKYANQQAAMATDYKTKVLLSKLDTEIRTDLQNNDQKAKLELNAIQNGQQKQFLQIELAGKMVDKFGDAGLEITRKIINGEKFTTEESNLVNSYAKGNFEAQQLQLDKEKAALKGQGDRIIPGQLAGVVDLAQLERNRETFKRTFYRKKYEDNRALMAAQVGKDLGLKTGLGNDIDTALVNNAKANNIPEEVLFSLIKQESGFNKDLVAQPNQAFPASSGKNAVGLTQITRDTAKTFGIDYERLKNDPVYAIESGVKIFKYVLDRNDGDIQKALIAYNYGSEMKIKTYDPLTQKIETYNDKSRDGVLPKQTQNYVASIQGFIDGYRDIAGKDPANERTIENRTKEANTRVDKLMGMYIDSGVPLTLADGVTPDIDFTTGKQKVRPYTPQELATLEEQAVNSAYGDRMLTDTDVYKNRMTLIGQKQGKVLQDSEAKNMLGLRVKQDFVNNVPTEKTMEFINSQQNITDEVRSFAIDELIRYSNLEEVDKKAIKLLTADEERQRRELEEKKKTIGMPLAQQKLEQIQKMNRVMKQFSTVKTDVKKKTDQGFIIDLGG